MKRLLIPVLAFATLGAIHSDAQAQRGSRLFGRTQQAAPASRRAKAPRPAKIESERPTKEQLKADRDAAKRFLTRQLESRRNNSRFFEKITVQRDYSGEYVLGRDAKVTAFLDLGDPRHPAFDPTREKEDEASIAHLPPAKRVHILVVPNQKREHVGKALGAKIGRSDLEASLEVVKAAEKLAADLKIVNPQIFLNSESRISVGYLHVHILGERGSATQYPSPMR